MACSERTHDGWLSTPHWLREHRTNPQGKHKRKHNTHTYTHMPHTQLFSSFEDVPVASGSIAQIHRGQLSDAAAVSSGSKPGQVVAIKVREELVVCVEQFEAVVHCGLMSLYLFSFLFLLVIEQLVSSCASLSERK